MVYKSRRGKKTGSKFEDAMRDLAGDQHMKDSKYNNYSVYPTSGFN